MSQFHVELLFIERSQPAVSFQSGFGTADSLGRSSGSMESQHEKCCNCDYELVQDIQGRMILHWNYRNLREIPDEVLNHGEHIEEIYLKRNCLEKLPANIGKLCNLTNLYLVGNQLESLPLEIGDLRCLKVLDVSQNYIKNLPSTVGDLTHLESLLVTYNQLESELPRCLKHLHRLKQLEVSGNRIYSIPSCVTEGLKSLEEFGIDRNPINSIPRNICLLRNLRYFSACRCNLLFLPSLPFHSLLHNSRTSSHRGSLNSNNRNLQFLFDGNPRLNYIPYWVLQQLGTNVECFGCGLDPGESDNGGPNPFHPHETAAASHDQTQLQLYTHRSDVNRLKIKLNFKGKRRTLHFDEDVVKLHHHHCGINRTVEGTATGKVMVPSLLELCLRQVHQLGLLEKNHQEKCCGVKPVIEPLIVPQRAGDSLISIRGNLVEKKDDEAIQPDLAIHEERKSVSNDPTSSKTLNTAVLPLPTSSAECTMSSKEITRTRKSNEKGNEQLPTCNQHHRNSLGERKLYDPNSICLTMLTETRSTTTGKEGNDQHKQTAVDNSSLENPLNLMLPFNLSKILMAGPVAKCFECLKPIFTESWPVIFHIPGWIFDENARERIGGEGGAEQNENAIQGDWDDVNDGKLSIGCTQFCSPTCVMRFQRGTKFSSNLVLNDLRCIVDNELQWTNG